MNPASSASPIRLVGFDADDTLWRSQDYFDAAQLDFERIVGLGKQLLRHPVELLPGIAEAVSTSRNGCMRPAMNPGYTVPGA